MKNQKDENGKRHGLWEWYHHNGQLSYRCNYNHELLHGLWEYYYSNGKLSNKGAYKKDIRIGLWYNIVEK